MKNTSRKKFRLTKKVFSVPYILFLLLFVVTPLVLILVNAFLDSDGSLTLENFKRSSPRSRASWCWAILFWSA